MPKYIHPDLVHLPPHEDVLLVWNARQWIPRKKGWLWWLLAILIVSLISSLAFYINLVLVSIFVVVVVIYLAVYQFHSQPKIETIVLTTTGIWINNRLIPYEEIETFRTVFITNYKAKQSDANPPVNVLELTLQKVRVMEIELEDMHPDQVNEILLHFVPQSEKKSIWNFWLAYILKL